MKLSEFLAAYLPLVEREMREVLAPPDASLAGHYDMLQYHMGWLDAELRPRGGPGGKRIRPALCLLCCVACGGDPAQAVAGAAALELLHNFSLLHDDIEDNSLTRRHRPTVWALFGLPQACNAGDAMFSLAHRTLFGLADRGLAAGQVLQVIRVVDDMCVALTEGQYLDLSFEGRLDVSEEEYVRMVAGKTAAMLAAAAQTGAIIAGAGPAAVAALRRAGWALGMAFQFQDDVLGIWGAEDVTGKSAASDILSKKKSLPVLHALASPRSGPELRARYAGRPFTEDDVPGVLELLDAAAARAYSETRARQASEGARQALRDAGLPLAGAAEAPLHELLDELLVRQA
jgi:geranylgeranyl diphosphate synthase type I